METTSSIDFNWPFISIFLILWIYLIVHLYLHHLGFPWKFIFIFIGSLCNFRVNITWGSTIAIPFNPLLLLCLIGMVGNQQIHEQLRIIDKKILLFTGIGAILGFLFPYIFLAIRTASSGYVQSNGQFFTFANAAYIIQQSSAEEFLMRGYLLNYLRKYNFNPMVAILIQAIVFVVGHIVVYKTDYMILSVILAVGIITGYLTWKSNHLAPAFVLHSVTNLVSQSM